MPHPSTAFPHALTRIGCAFLLAGLATLLVACGGGSSSPAAVAVNGGELAVAATATPGTGSTEVSVASPPVTHLSGSIVKGPVTGAQVCVYELLVTGKGKQLGCTSSRADGSYALSLDFVGEVVVEAVGGNYTDETTGLAGVPLSAPLTSATRLGGGTSIVHATPLTALAFTQAMVPGSGGLSLTNFETKSSLVKDAFGLGADVDLKTTLPNVDATTANAYGNALRSVSKMLGLGATLAGVVGNTNLEMLKIGYEKVAQCGAQIVQEIPGNLPQQPQVVYKPGYLFIYGGSNSTDGLRIQLEYPDQTWRALLAKENTPMGCTVAENSVERVVMHCPPAALGGNLTILSEQESTADLLSSGLPTNGVLAVGRYVTTYGKVIVAGNITLRAKNLYVNDSATLMSTGGNITIDTITGNKFPLITKVSLSTQNTSTALTGTGSTGSIYLGCSANSLDASGNVPGLLLGDNAVNLVSSGLQTNSTSGGLTISAGALVVNGSNLASNYGGGITVTNTGTITKATLSLSSSGQ